MLANGVDLTIDACEAAAMFVRVVPAKPEDGSQLQEIERLAGVLFRDIGMPDVADHEPPSVEVFTQYARAGRSWVAVAEGDRLIGYVLVDEVDGNAHIEQVSVRPDHQGKGVGRALIDHVGTWAGAASLPAITLSTFLHVPWNAPLYRHLGFRDLTAGEFGVQLGTIRDAESARGLHPTGRVCMRREVQPDT
jgi:GNAT superfamily N-acetyltransferase